MPSRKVQGAVYESYSTSFQHYVGRYLDTFAVSENPRNPHTSCTHADTGGVLRPARVTSRCRSLLLPTFC